jgi:GcrA cell cycle regulator
MTGRANLWPAERDAKLAELWAQGLTARQIEAEMLRAFQVIVTKNAIFGRAHRLGLPKRPSIRAAKAPKPRAVFSARGAPPANPGGSRNEGEPARHEVPASDGGRAAERRHLVSQREAASRGRFLGVSSLNSAPVVAVNGGAGVLFEALRPEHCRWPLWNDEAPAPSLTRAARVGGRRAASGENEAGGRLLADNFRYCGCTRVAGRPYCEGHVAIAYLKPKKPEPGARTIAETFHTEVARNSVFELRAGFR